MYKKELAQKSENRKSKKSQVAAIAMAGVLAFGGIAAYFTDADTTTNTFTVGNVQIDLQESNWTPPTDITPGQEFDKNPLIVNDGINDAYVFMSVTVPYANIVCAEDDGTRLAAADTELFSYDVKDGWIELTNYMVKDTDAKTITHLYAYCTDDSSTTQVGDAMTAVAAGATTESLFDYARFCNVIEDEGLEGTTLDVVVNAYAIQTQNINDAKDALDGDNTDGKVAPTKVWDVLIKQNPDVAVPGLESEFEGEEVNTDIKK